MTFTCALLKPGAFGAVIKVENVIVDKSELTFKASFTTT